MKLKTIITKRLLVIALASILFTALVLGVVSWYSLSSQARESLKNYAAAVSGAININSENGIQTDLSRLVEGGYRLTLIAPDGEVVFESNTSEHIMDNHLSRPEIAEAFKSGYGENTHTSDTFGKNTYYSAYRLENGMVLRAATVESSVVSLISAFVTPVCLLLLALFLVCSAIASRFTSGIIKPIEEMAADTDKVAYKELVPFARTIRKQRDEIHKQMEQLVKADKVRKTFTANVSHELKTPLTSISGYAEMIETGIARPEDITGFAHKIRHESRRLVLLIEDILKLSQLDSGEQNIVKTDVDLYGIAEEVCGDLGLNAKKRGVTIDLHGEKAMINGDPKFIYELVYNLCDNAIRYNRENGRVDVTVDAPDAENGARLTVSDTGIGIPKSKQEKVFERFYRVDKSRSKTTGGTGLGLAIVKHIASVHEASVSLQSVEGAGTTISVFFPPHFFHSAP